VKALTKAQRAEIARGFGIPMDLLLRDMKALGKERPGITTAEALPILTERYGLAPWEEK
jgi:hypothetical protein